MIRYEWIVECPTDFLDYCDYRHRLNDDIMNLIDDMNFRGRFYLDIYYI
jgi:hypothetical protein